MLPFQLIFKQALPTILISILNGDIFPMLCGVVLNASYSHQQTKGSFWRQRLHVRLFATEDAESLQAGDADVGREVLFQAGQQACHTLLWNKWTTAVEADEIEQL